MKILYGIQGTGNGHITRAMEIIPHLQQRGEVDVLLSGVHSELSLPFPVKYRQRGLGFVFGKKGGIDLVETYKKSRLKQFYREVTSLPVEKYDLVISDFEPITAWACIRNQKSCVGLSNQVSLLSPLVPKGGSEDLVGKFIIRNYAPCSVNIGFSYKNYDHNIYTPIIRKGLRERLITEQGHYTVYLPSYGDEKIEKVLGQFEGHAMEVFSKSAKEVRRVGNLTFHPLSKSRFEESVTSASGIISAAGFGTTTEALFMGKKLLVVPQKNQYEQACNAEALRGLGIPVLKSLKKKYADTIDEWLNEPKAVKMAYPDHTASLVEDLILHQFQEEDPYLSYIERGQYQLKRA